MSTTFKGRIRSRKSLRTALSSLRQHRQQRDTLHAEIEAQVKAIQAKADDAINALREEHAGAYEAEVAQVLTLEEKITSYAQRNRTDLLEGGRQSAQIEGAVLKWRKGTVKADVDDAEALIEELLEEGMTDCVVYPAPRLDRRALVKQRARIEELGLPVEFVQSESFEIITG